LEVLVKGLCRIPLHDVMDQTGIFGIHPDPAVTAAALRLDVPPDGEQQPYGVILVLGGEMHVDRAGCKRHPVV